MWRHLAMDGLVAFGRNPFPRTGLLGRLLCCMPNSGDLVSEFSGLGSWILAKLIGSDSLSQVAGELRRRVGTRRAVVDFLGPVAPKRSARGYNEGHCVLKHGVVGHVQGEVDRQGGLVH